MAASSDSLTPVLQQLREAGKHENRQKMGLMSSLADQAFDRQAPSVASSSDAPAKQEYLLVDIDGTLIHGGTNTMMNDGLIAQLQAIKQHNPDTKIYLFSSMDVSSLNRTEEVNWRTKLFQQLEGAGVIDGIVTTADLKFKSSGTHVAGSFYQEIYKPLSNLLYEKGGIKRELTAEELKQSLRHLSEDTQTTRPEFSAFLIEFIEQNAASDDPEALVANLIALAALKTMPDLSYGIHKDSNQRSSKSTEKGRLFQLFHEVHGERIQRATLIDDSAECIASFVEACVTLNVPFFAHNAKDYDAFLEGTNDTQKKVEEDVELVSRFFVEEYAAFQDMYTALVQHDQGRFQLAKDQLMLVYGAASALTNKGLPGMKRDVSPESNARLVASEAKRINLVKWSSSSDEFVQKQLADEQGALEQAASVGNPIALYQLAKALSPNPMPVFQLDKDKEGKVSAFLEIAPDLVSSYHLAVIARELLHKLGTADREAYEPQIIQLINQIQQALQKENIDPDTAACKEPGIRIHGLNPAELHKYVSLARLAVPDPVRILQRRGAELAAMDNPGRMMDAIIKARETLQPEEFKTLLICCRNALVTDERISNRLGNTLTNKQHSLDLDYDAPRVWRVLCRECVKNHGFNPDEISKGIEQAPQAARSPSG